MTLPRLTSVLVMLFVATSPINSDASPAKTKAARCLSLRNAEASHRENPVTFSIPRSDERRNLREGDVVKMIFEPCQPGESAERMWVIVKQKLPDGYIGALDNIPATIENLEAGEEFKFGPEHVIAIKTDKDRYDPPEGKIVLASPEIIRDGVIPQFARRVAAEKKGDSGWRVFATKKPEAAGSLIEVSADDLLDKFAVLDSILYERGTTAWLWNEDELEYQAVPADL